MQKVDYNQTLYQNYQQGRACSEETYQLWMEAIAKHLEVSNDMTILDLGSGTGRYSPRLAGHFNAQVIGVEPSHKMRAIAEKSNTDSRVIYRKGAAENIPVEDGTCDFALLSMVIHHFDDLDRCGQELHRILKSDGRVFIRNSFKDRLDDYTFYKFFPSAKAIDNQRQPSVEEVEAIFAENRLDKMGLQTIAEQIDKNLYGYYERMKLKVYSSLVLISEDEFQMGLAAMKAAVDTEDIPSPVAEAIDLLIFRKQGGTIREQSKNERLHT